jgi:hypothetical protein
VGINISSHPNEVVFIHRDRLFKNTVKSNAVVVKIRQSQLRNPKRLTTIQLQNQWSQVVKKDECLRPK